MSPELKTPLEPKVQRKKTSRVVSGSGPFQTQLEDIYLSRSSLVLSRLGAMLLLGVTLLVNAFPAQCQVLSFPTCPAGYVGVWNSGGVQNSTFSSLCTPNAPGVLLANENGQLVGYPYPSVSVWAASITAACDGSTWGNVVQWIGSAYPCYSGNQACIDANIGTPPAQPTLNLRAAINFPTCKAGFYVMLPNVPNTGAKCTACGDPIDPGTGNEYREDIDFFSPNHRLMVSRAFNSQINLTTSTGSRWQHNLDRRIVATYSSLAAVSGGGQGVSTVEASAADACLNGWPEIARSSEYPTAIASFNGTTCQLSNGVTLPVYSTDFSAAWSNVAGASFAASLQRRDGAVETFSCTNGVCAGRSNLPLTMSASSSGFVVTDDTGNTESYSTLGTLSSIAYRDGYVLTLSYTNGNLSSTADNHGHQISYTYTNGALTSIQVPDGSSINYGYDAYSRLSTVTYQDSTVRTYQYLDPINPSLVTGVIDENNAHYATISYDSSGKANGSHLGTAADSTSIIYNSDGSATITDSLGAIRTYAYTQVNGRPEIQSISGAACDHCGKAATTYDSAGYVKSETDFNNVATCHIFDDVHGLETSRTEGVASNMSCTSPITGLRTIQTDWNTMFRTPTERRTYNPNNALEAKTDWIYNARGQLTAQCAIDPADTSGYVCSATTAPGVTAKVRRWTYTYCDSVGSGCPLVGLLKKVDGPRLDATDTTNFAYYATTDLSGCATLGSTCHYLGDVQTITDAAGHVTTYVSYDKNGRPTRIKDANSTLTDLTYHQRGWLLTRTVRYNASGAASSNDATTTFAYDNVGNVKQVTQPDGSYLAYNYDDAHRLTDVQDNLGNKVHYTLDAAGNRIAEQTYDPSSVLKRSLSRQYDQLNRLTATLNAASAAVHTYINPAEAPPTGTTYTDGYDGNGNAIYSIDGTSSHVGTEQQYDPLNRLIKTLQDHAGSGATHDTQTQYAYDTRDNLRSVTDPDSLTTSYTYDGLNNLTALSSPDTGNTGYTYDAAGNRATQTDARGILTSYTYDALNRLTGITYPTTSLNVTYAYDQSNTITGCSTSYPIGRLTKITDSSGSTTYCYDRRGNVLKKTQVTNGVTLTTSNTYTLADRIATISYPSTAVVTYTRNSIGQITKVTYKPTPTGTATTLVSAATYYPYGPLNKLTFGNGRTLTKTYDQDYAIDKVVSSVSTGLTLDATVDVLGNLINASSTVGASPPTQRYQYDPLYRLTAVQNGSGTALLSFAYDPTGDRISKTPQGSGAQTYSYAPGTHHLTSVAGVSRSVDANGNTTSLNGTTLTYDNRNRLAAAGTESYSYNGKGERVSKSGPATLFVYTEGGMLLGEYSSTGAVQREYIPLDGMLVGAAAGSQIYYVETDQLGTPRQVIQPGATPATDVQVWKWDYFANNSAFGENTPSPQTIVFNNKFPGQYFDAETGLNYNYFRDYESGSGRYVESDPAGLIAAPNTYAYSLSRPLNIFDPSGLKQVCKLEHRYNVQNIPWMNNKSVLIGDYWFNSCHFEPDPPPTPTTTCCTPTTKNCTKNCFEKFNPWFAGPAAAAGARTAARIGVEMAAAATSAADGYTLLTFDGCILTCLADPYAYDCQ